MSGLHSTSKHMHHMRFGIERRVRSSVPLGSTCLYLTMRSTFLSLHGYTCEVYNTPNTIAYRKDVHTNTDHWLWHIAIALNIDLGRWHYVLYKIWNISWFSDFKSTSINNSSHDWPISSVGSALCCYCRLFRSHKKKKKTRHTKLDLLLFKSIHLLLNLVV